MITPALTDELVIDRSGGIVHVTLNRPVALNALSPAMIAALVPVLQETGTILVTGAGGKAFCAGGDVKDVWQILKTGNLALACDYFRYEYEMNAALYAHKGDYVSFLNGIVMGGGYGVSAHGSHLIATEATQFAMPEVKIGFFPDVGVMYHLARTPHQFGTWLALTGNTIGAADMLYAGLAHAYVPLGSFDGFRAALAGGVDHALDRYAVDVASDGIFVVHQDLIARCFAFDTVEDIIAALENDGSAFALQTAADIQARSPLSLKIALRHLRLSQSDTFDGVIARDLHLARKFMEKSDFVEGVRAALIDRDRSPRWNPATLAAVGDDLLALYFDPTQD